MDVWEWCIYRQTNGEWSQYTHHTFSRLRFSKTPMPVPRTDKCAHRIQVTQQARYLEMTAKVNMVPPPWYGTDFTSQLHIRHRDLIPVSLAPHPVNHWRHPSTTITTTIQLRWTSRSYHCHMWLGTVRVWYHGWVLATNDEIILLRGGGPDNRIQSLMTSYRSELGWLVVGLTVLGTLYRADTINVRSIRFLCNYESAVTTTEWPKYDSIFHNTKRNWDLIKTIQDLTVPWCDGITFRFHWVKGHT
jgi:hypothetical protein